MNRLFILLVIWSAHPAIVYGIEKGRDYDFICSDGQDILNARLIDENENKYTVKLAASVQTISIEKRFVTKVSPVILPDSPLLHAPVRYAIGLHAGITFGTGRFSDFTSAGGTMGGSAFRVAQHPARLGLRANASFFSRFDSALQLYDVMAAVDYKLFQFANNLELRPGLAAGLIFVHGRVLSAVVSGLTPGTRSWLTIAYPLMMNFEINVQLGILYVADRSTLLIFPEIFAAGTYRL